MSKASVRIGKYLRKLRTLLGLGVEEFAKLVKLDPAHLSYIEEGKCELTKDQHAIISDVFHIVNDEFY